MRKILFCFFSVLTTVICTRQTLECFLSTAFAKNTFSELSKLTQQEHFATTRMSRSKKQTAIDQITKIANASDPAAKRGLQEDFLTYFKHKRWSEGSLSAMENLQQFCNSKFKNSLSLYFPNVCKEFQKRLRVNSPGNSSKLFVQKADFFQNVILKSLKDLGNHIKSYNRNNLDYQKSCIRKGQSVRKADQKPLGEIEDELQTIQVFKISKRKTSKPKVLKFYDAELRYIVENSSTKKAKYVPFKYEIIKGITPFYLVSKKISRVTTEKHIDFDYYPEFEEFEEFELTTEASTKLRERMRDIIVTSKGTSSMTSLPTKMPLISTTTGIQSENIFKQLTKAKYPKTLNASDTKYEKDIENYEKIIEHRLESILENSTLNQATSEGGGSNQSHSKRYEYDTKLVATTDKIDHGMSEHETNESDGKIIRSSTENAEIQKNDFHIQMTMEPVELYSSLIGYLKEINNANFEKYHLNVSLRDEKPEEGVVVVDSWNSVPFKLLFIINMFILVLIILLLVMFMSTLRRERYSNYSNVNSYEYDDVQPDASSSVLNVEAEEELANAAANKEKLSDHRVAHQYYQYTLPGNVVLPSIPVNFQKKGSFCTHAVGYEPKDCCHRIQNMSEHQTAINLDALKLDEKLPAIEPRPSPPHEKHSDPYMAGDQAHPNLEIDPKGDAKAESLNNVEANPNIDSYSKVEFNPKGDLNSRIDSKAGTYPKIETYPKLDSFSKVKLYSKIDSNRMAYPCVETCPKMYSPSKLYSPSKNEIYPKIDSPFKIESYPNKYVYRKVDSSQDMMMENSHPSRSLNFEKKNLEKSDLESYHDSLSARKSSIPGKREMSRITLRKLNSEEFGQGISTRQTPSRAETIQMPCLDPDHLEQRTSHWKPCCKQSHHPEYYVDDSFAKIYQRNKAEQLPPSNLQRYLEPIKDHQYNLNELPYPRCSSKNPNQNLNYKDSLYSLCQNNEHLEHRDGGDMVCKSPFSLPSSRFGEDTTNVRLKIRRIKFANNDCNEINEMLKPSITSINILSSPEKVQGKKYLESKKDHMSMPSSICKKCTPKSNMVHDYYDQRNNQRSYQRNNKINTEGKTDQFDEQINGQIIMRDKINTRSLREIPADRFILEHGKNIGKHVPGSAGEQDSENGDSMQYTVMIHEEDQFKEKVRSQQQSPQTPPDIEKRKSYHVRSCSNRPVYIHPKRRLPCYLMKKSSSSASLIKSTHKTIERKHLLKIKNRHSSEDTMRNKDLRSSRGSSRYHHRAINFDVTEGSISSRTETNSLRLPHEQRYREPGYGADHHVLLAQKSKTFRHVSSKQDHCTNKYNRSCFENRPRIEHRQTSATELVREDKILSRDDTEGKRFHSFPSPGSSPESCQRRHMQCCLEGHPEPQSPFIGSQPYQAHR